MAKHAQQETNLFIMSKKIPPESMNVLKLLWLGKHARYHAVFLQPCKETEISLRFTEMLILHIVNVGTLSGLHVLAYFFPKNISLSV